MALAKEDSGESNPQTPAPVERLLNLLVDLSFNPQTSNPPVELPASKEKIQVSPHSQGDEIAGVTLRESKPHDSESIGNEQQANGSGFPPQPQGTISSSSEAPIWTLDSLVNASEGDLDTSQKIGGLENPWQETQIHLTTDSGLQMDFDHESPANHKQAEAVKDTDEKHLKSSLLEEQIEERSGQAMSNTSNPDKFDPESPLDRLRTLLLTPELAESQQVIASLKQKLTNLQRQIYEPSELINLLLPLIAELLSLKVAEAREEVVEAIAPIIDAVIQTKTAQDKAAMSAALAPVIPTAITQQLTNDREEITTALGPAMAGAIKEQINIKPAAMVDALYPIIGNTIVKYMAEEIRAINEKIENTLSVEGVSRKIRANLQGISEAELILKEVMLFTVQAIFLIHKASGLVVSEIQPSDHQRLESEMVAGMLTAIRSFVNDCIAQSGNVSELDQIDYGNSKIVLEVAGYCYLAVVVEGEPPQWFTRNLRQTLSTIVQRCGKSIELFDGNPATIPKQVQQTLAALMVTNSKQQAKKPPTLLIGSVLLSCILLPWGIYQYRDKIDRRIEADTALALASTPELAVYRLDVHVQEETLKLSGKLPNQYLRQRAEEIARGVKPTLKLDDHIIVVNVPPDPVLTVAEVKRVTAILNQMEGVAIAARYEAGAVTVEGTVKWDADARKITQAMKQIPGVYSVTNTSQPQQSGISTRIYFAPGSAELKSADTDQIIQIRTFLQQYPTTQIRILGHSDISSFVLSEQIGLKRAEVVRDALKSQGVDPSRLQVAGTINLPVDVGANQPLLLSRCVEFKVITTDTQNQ